MHLSISKYLIQSEPFERKSNRECVNRDRTEPCNSRTVPALPTVISQTIRLYINFMTLIPNWTFTELWGIIFRNGRRVHRFILCQNYMMFLLILYPPPLFWGWILLILRSPKGGCCSISDDLSCWFPWSICEGCGMPARNAYPSGHLVSSPFLGLACAPILEIRFFELVRSIFDI